MLKMREEIFFKRKELGEWMNRNYTIRILIINIVHIIGISEGNHMYLNWHVLHLPWQEAGCYEN